MKMHEYVTLGRSGLRVSPLCLGTMTFGNSRWGSEDEESRAIFDAYVDAGGNFLDTADGYALEVMGTGIAVDSPLHGAHQQRNVALAIAAAVELATEHGFPITAAAMEAGIHATEWPGRLETVRRDGWPDVILDVAHNPAGAWALRAAVHALDEAGQAEAAPRRPQVLVFGCLRDKPVTELGQILFPLFDRVVLVPVNSPRATAKETMQAAAAATGVATEAAENAEQALAAAYAAAGGDGRIVVSGSVYLVGEARHWLRAQ